MLLGVGSRLEMPYMRWRDSMRYERGAERRAEAHPDRHRSCARCRASSPTSASWPTPRPRAGCSRIGCEPRDAESRARRRTSLPRSASAQRAHAAHPAADRVTSTPSAACCRATDFSFPSCRRSGSRRTRAPIPCLAPRTYISEGFQGTLGFGFPTALGAKVANPDQGRRVRHGRRRLHVRRARARDRGAIPHRRS